MFAAKTLGDEDKARFVQRKASETSPLLSVPPKISILLVDYNYAALHEMRKIMRQYRYEVMMCLDAEDALEYLRTSSHDINIVIWEYHMPKIDGIEALKIIDLEMDLPVVIMSDDDEPETVMEATIIGACYFVRKPVGEEVVANIWQHVVRWKMTKPGLIKPIRSDLAQTDSVGQNKCDSETVDQDNGEQIIGNEVQRAAEEPPMTLTGESQQVQSDLVEIAGLGQENNDSMTITNDNGEENMDTKVEKKSKKKRMIWTVELQNKFLRGIEMLGGSRKANPKTLLKCLQDMNVEGLTRTNVASHLQKHRMSVEATRTPRESLAFGWSSEYRPSSLLCPINVETAAISSHLMNDQTVNPIQENQYPNGYLAVNNNQFMTSPLPPLPYFDQDLLQQQQHQSQQHYGQLSHEFQQQNQSQQQYGQLSHELQQQHQSQQLYGQLSHELQQQHQFQQQYDQLSHELKQQHQSQQQYGQLSHELQQQHQSQQQYGQLSHEFQQQHQSQQQYGQLSHELQQQHQTQQQHGQLSHELQQQHQSQQQHGQISHELQQQHQSQQQYGQLSHEFQQQHQSQQQYGQLSHELQQQHQSQQQHGQLSHELDYGMNMQEPEQSMGADLTNLAYGNDLTNLAFGSDLGNLDLIFPSSPFDPNGTFNQFNM